MKKTILFLSFFLFVAIVCIIIAKSFGTSKTSDKKTTIVTSFQPVYVLTKNIVGDNSDIDVINLASNTTGCLHDYQLTSADMKTLEKADVFIINGGGMETFLENATDIYPNLKIIDSSKNINMLPNITNHNHEDEHNEDEHHEDEHNEDEHHEDEHNEDEHHEHGEYNAHIWLNTSNYMKQISNISTELCSNFPEYSSDFNTNAEIYTNKISDLNKEIKDTFSKSKLGDTIIFHDSFAYIADEIGLNVVKCIEIEEDTSLSAGEISECVDEVKEHNIHCLFTEKQFKTTIADSIANETNAQVFVIDTLVSGDDSNDSYINGMKNNISSLKQALNIQ